ncbi:MAG TPA: hypothetical protein EYP14_04510, partial [Planctomycetaceae bacterium]|nr:hypothetical protein [Planctomycetaceae bacterium]
AARNECRASGEGDMRDHMTSLQILKDLGLTRVRLLTNHPDGRDAFLWSGMGIQVEEVPIWCARHGETTCLRDPAQTSSSLDRLRGVSFAAKPS